MTNRFNVPSYMGQQPMRFSDQGHGGGCRVGHFSPSQPMNYSPVSAPSNRAMPASTPEPACQSNPGMVMTATATGAATGAITGSKSGNIFGTAAGTIYGALVGAVGGMTRDAQQVQECLDKRPKP